MLEFIQAFFFTIAQNNPLHSSTHAAASARTTSKFYRSGKFYS
jgi:hypothetical protein